MTTPTPKRRGRQKPLPEPIFPYVLAQLEASKGKWATIAKDTGVPYKTVTKIAQRYIKNPGVDSVQRLHDYFRTKAS